VLIPDNDYSNDKIILGKCSPSEEEKPITYVSPMEKIVSVKSNYTSGVGPQEMVANGKTTVKTLVTKEITDQTINFDTLYISADFKTLMNEYDMREGNYGLLVILETTGKVLYSLTLDNIKDMFGNTYAYETYFN
jgi:hypothetical protein